MKYSFSNRYISNNILTYKFNLGNSGTNQLNNIYIKDEQGNKLDIYNFSLIQKYKIDDDFLINNIDLLDKVILPFFKKEYIWSKNDFNKNKGIFSNYYNIVSNSIIIQQNNTGTLSYSIKINIDELIKNIINNKDNKIIIDKIFFLATRKNKVNILNNMKYFSNIILYDGFPDITYINNLKIFDNNKIEFLLSKKSGSKKNIFYSTNIERVLYYSFADYYNNYNNKIISNEILIKFLQGIFEKTDKDTKNKQEYFELVNKIKQKLSYKENDFYKILEGIILISIL